FPDLLPEIATWMPQLRGRVVANAMLADITWFRVGGPAQVLFTPADEPDLAYFLRPLPREVPVVVIGLGSHLLVFDRGVPGSAGGALRMSAGGRRRGTREVLVEARAVDRDGNIQVLPLEAMQLTYRHCGVPDDWIFTEALFQGSPGEPAAILEQME